MTRRERLALELALAARDALATEVLELRERVASAERDAWNAEVVASMWQEAAEQAAGDRDDVTLAITRDGQVFAAQVAP